MDAELIAALELCKAVRKTNDGEFSCKWLRAAGARFHHSLLTNLVEFGYLTVQYNGIVRRGTAWYKLA